MSFDQTFSDLISGRGFDRFQSGLVARFEAAGINYSVTYGQPTSKSAMWLDFETEDAIGRVTLWESGECDMEVLDATTGGDLLREHYEFMTTREFFDTYPKVPLLLRKMRDDIVPLNE